MLNPRIPPRTHLSLPWQRSTSLVLVDRRSASRTLFPGVSATSVITLRQPANCPVSLNCHTSTSSRSYHPSAPVSRSLIGRWLRRGRGMRRRLGAWAESVGLVDHARDPGQQDVADALGAEELYVMPGWAVARHVNGQEKGPYDISFSISGFCSRSRPPSRVTRTERVMVSAIKKFAALPNLPGNNPDNQPMGPLATAVGMAFMEQAAEDEAGKEQAPAYETYQSRRRRNTAMSTNSLGSTTGSSRQTTHPSRQSSIASSISSQNTVFIGDEAVTSAHRTLQQRLAPFWSTVLPSRRVLFDIYLLPDDGRTISPEARVEERRRLFEQQDPLHSFEVFTDKNGHFSQTAQIPWEVVQKFADSDSKPKRLEVRARLDYEVIPPTDDSNSYRARAQRAISTYGRNATDRSLNVPSLESLSLNTPGEPQVVEWAEMRVSRAGGVHIISDLDDTVKHSDILAGPREVCRNVFCRPLDQLCVPGMNEMYQRLDKRGVSGFHYVSNSPSQLFPSIRKFLEVNAFPTRHSLKLKYYGGRNIFSSLYESPAERKRTSLHNLFDGLPLASFILFGDSAEQDLELYVEFAKLHPDRVVAIAIRDVTSDRALILQQELRDLSQGNMRLTEEPETLDPSTPVTQLPNQPLGRSTPSTSLLTEDEAVTLTSAQQKILQRAAEWEQRKERARNGVSSKTMLLFYKEPEEIEDVVGALVDVRSAQ